MKRACFVKMALAQLVLCAHENVAAQYPDYSDLRLAKPDRLPLTIDVSAECGVAMNDFREWAERALERAGMEPVGWPALQGEKPWFGIHVGLSCNGQEHAYLSMSFIDSIDGTLQLYGGIGDNPAGREHSDVQHIAAAGLAGPEYFPTSYGMTYSSFVERVLARAMQQFLEKRFSL
ncbi:MAG: hypothetical protein R3284_10825 [Rubricoccaceae bacterium]|nr:hypothetical protein [Rubricoccaceae bacterium]